MEKKKGANEVTVDKKKCEVTETTQTMQPRCPEEYPLRVRGPGFGGFFCRFIEFSFLGRLRGQKEAARILPPPNTRHKYLLLGLGFGIQCRFCFLSFSSKFALQIYEPEVKFRAGLERQRKTKNRTGGQGNRGVSNSTGFPFGAKKRRPAVRKATNMRLRCGSPARSSKSLGTATAADPPSPSSRRVPHCISRPSPSAMGRLLLRRPIWI